MGRNKQPIDLVVAKGRKHLSKAEIEKRRAEELKVDFKDVQAPDYLPPKLKSEFDEIAYKLLTIGIMTELDEHTLASYLLSKQTYLQYTTLLGKATKEGRYKDAMDIMVVQDKAFKQCRASAQDMGLTISSRCKLITPQVDPPPKENKFSKFKR